MKLRYHQENRQQNVIWNTFAKRDKIGLYTLHMCLLIQKGFTSELFSWKSNSETIKLSQMSIVSKVLHKLTLSTWSYCIGYS